MLCSLAYCSAESLYISSSIVRSGLIQSDTTSCGRLALFGQKHFAELVGDIAPDRPCDRTATPCFYRRAAISGLSLRIGPCDSRMHDDEGKSPEEGREFLGSRDMASQSSTFIRIPFTSAAAAPASSG